MLNCDFCEIVNNKNLELAQGIILYEDELLTIFPAREAPVPGYLMIIINRHINSLAELSNVELKHVDNVIAKIITFYKKYFNINSILLEHGSTKSGRHIQSIVQAHLHLIPYFDGKNLAYQGTTELHNLVQDYLLPFSDENEFYALPNGSFIMYDGQIKKIFGPFDKIYKRKVLASSSNDVL